ncbi:MAG: TIGR00282 family metallophosphoesterase [Bacilli bacterium]|jgi:metallophosphoesterase (TIGR00282 family)|nr:TIGR00282 family metallophosphoesterase [Bacilli bacterium]
MVTILFLGDIDGPVGRKIVQDKLAEIKAKYQIDFTIANGENATHGKGLSLTHYKELKKGGIDAITMGNHFFRISEVITESSSYEDMVRPANLHPSVPGNGSKIFLVGGIKIRVTNLLGRVFVEGADLNPFDTLDNLITSGEKADIHIVDFHAEATGEKMCLAKAFDGKVTAVIGTHTHVQTNDSRILPLGTGFISDAGMCGAYDSILGVSPEGVITRTWKGLPSVFETPDKGKGILSGVVVKADESTGLCCSIEPINYFED